MKQTEKFWEPFINVCTQSHCIEALRLSCNHECFQIGWLWIVCSSNKTIATIFWLKMQLLIDGAFSSALKVLEPRTCIIPLHSKHLLFPLVLMNLQRILYIKFCVFVFKRWFLSAAWIHFIFPSSYLFLFICFYCSLKAPFKVLCFLTCLIIYSICLYRHNKIMLKRREPLSRNGIEKLYDFYSALMFGCVYSQTVFEDSMLFIHFCEFGPLHLSLLCNHLWRLTSRTLKF